MYVYAPTMKAATSIAFMVWYTHSFCFTQDLSQLQILTYYKIMCGYDSVT